MTAFNVSRSTALRDIVAIQSLGVPLYADFGKHGGYRVLDTCSLPPITFTKDETYALFFAVKMLAAFQSTPFDVAYKTLASKFYESLTADNKQAVAAMEKHVDIRQANHRSISTSLKALLDASIRQVVVCISYLKEGRAARYNIQPLGLVSREGNWYCSSYCLQSKDYRVFRCDRIEKVSPTDLQPAKLGNYTIHNEHNLRRKSKEARNFRVRLTDKGVEDFYKNNYPNMELTQDKGHVYLTGWYEPNEEKFVVRYLLAFGEDARIMQPAGLRTAMRRYLSGLMMSYTGT